MHCKDLNADNVNDLLKEYDLPFSHIKRVKQALTDESKAKVASVDKMDMNIWWDSSIEIEICHDANIIFTCGIKGCGYDNLRGRQ